MAKSDFRRGAIPYLFLPMPKDILLSTEYQSLPFSSKALMLDLMGQFTGNNNGRLCPSFEVMRRSGWTAPNTLMRAKVALLECSFAVLTRKGHAPRTAEWIGFTWWKLNWLESMDIAPRDFPYLNFTKATMPDPNTGRDQAKHNNSDVQKLYPCPAKTGSGYTETVSMAQPN